jgi:flagellar basal-body rod protein FlgC
VVAQAVPLNFSRQFGLLAGGGVRVASIVPDAQPPRMAYEPGHPFANAQGMVAYPAVDHTQQMLVLNTALRAYEANIVAMNAAKTMASRTLEIGGQG